MNLLFSFPTQSMSAHAISSSNCCTSETGLLLVAISECFVEKETTVDICSTCLRPARLHFKPLVGLNQPIKFDSARRQWWPHLGKPRPPRPTVDQIKMAEVLNRSPHANSLPLGAYISCTTTHGDVLRGNIIATDETNEAVVISIL